MKTPLTWQLGNGEIECNVAKDNCFQYQDNGGCWVCPNFQKMIQRLHEYEKNDPNVIFDTSIFLF